jgi:large subunit ribosomal protein L4
MKLTTYTKTGNESKTPLTVNDAVFNAEVNKNLLAQGIRIYLANQRQGTSKVKNRSAVIRTKKKWLKQKGTGNARHGSRNAPIFVGGGVAHGPTGLTNWRLKLTKRSKSQALIAALSAQKDNIVVCDGLNELSGKTKQAVDLLGKMVKQKEKVLVVLTESKPEIIKSLRNLQKVVVTRAERLNIYEVALADKIIITSDAVQQLEEKLVKYIRIVKKVSKKSS